MPSAQWMAGMTHMSMLVSDLFRYHFLVLRPCHLYNNCDCLTLCTHGHNGFKMRCGRYFETDKRDCTTDQQKPCSKSWYTFHVILKAHYQDFNRWVHTERTLSLLQTETGSSTQTHKVLDQYIKKYVILVCLKVSQISAWCSCQTFEGISGRIWLEVKIRI